MSDHVLVKSSPINQRGVFAARDFREGEVVVRWDNTREITQTEYAALPSLERNYIEVQESTILLVGVPERYINHSCAPNTIPGDMCDIAARDIKTGEEITTDYSNFFIPDGSFTCGCASVGCRGVITGRTSKVAI